MPDYVTLESAANFANCLYNVQMTLNREGYAVQVSTWRRARQDFIQAVGNPDEEYRNALLRATLIEWQEKMQKNATKFQTQMIKKEWGDIVGEAQRILQYKQEPCDPNRYVLWHNNGTEPYRVYDTIAKAYVTYVEKFVTYTKRGE